MLLVHCVLLLSTVLQTSKPALKSLDPVELCRGNESAGDASLAVELGGYRYAFRSEETRKLFLADPERYGIQLGGSCGRMGPGSGRGGPDRFAVHDGRIYLFASAGCRDNFVAAPERHLDPDEAPAQGDDAAKKRGRELIEHAVAAHGGAARIDGMKSLVLLAEWDEESNGETTHRTRGWMLSFPDDVRYEDHYGDWHSTRVARKGESFTYYGEGKLEDEHASATRDMHRRLAREPLMILRARHRPDFVAVSLGETTQAAGLPTPPPELARERVLVSFDGTRTELSIEKQSGHIVAASYRGRGPRMLYGPLVRRYDDASVAPNGVRVPLATSTEFEGVVQPARKALKHVVEVDGPVDAQRFARPEPR